MSDIPKAAFQPVNDPIQAHSQVSSHIEILNFPDMVSGDEISRIQVFYERIGQEVYNTRKKNYTWGFRVIEPQFLNFSDRIALVSKLYKEEELNDLNSVIFKLFTEFNNIVLAMALHMHIPIRGIIRIGDTYRGAVRSRKPAVMSGKDPLILSDLLKVFSIEEIFPTGFSEGLIPAVDVPFHFGKGICRTMQEVCELDSIGVFMPVEYNRDKIADVTILSGMMNETQVQGKSYFACNWKEWMSEHTSCFSDNIIAFAESQVKNKDAHSSKWKSLIDYSSKL